MAWLTNWGYRKSITISNSNPSTLTDFQTLITINTSILISSKMRSDCGDLRFTDTDGSATLNYWIESGCNTSLTKIWVKIPSIPNGSKVIYMYYGNPSVTYDNSLGGTNTFINFDTFNNLSQWGVYSGKSSVVINSTHAFDGTNAAMATAGATQVMTRTQPSGNLIFEIQMYDSGGSGSTEYAATDLSDTIYRMIGILSTSSNYYTYRIGNVQIITSIPRTIGWHSIKYAYDSTNVKMYIDDQLLSTEAARPVSGYSFGDWWGGSFSTWFDAYRVRKYVSPEPSLLTIGTEELPPVFDSLTIAGD